METKNKINGWKITAIIFIIIFILQTSFWIWLVLDSNDQKEKTAICYYDICEGYLVSSFEYNFCKCYNFDNGEYVLEKTERIPNFDNSNVQILR